MRCLNIAFSTLLLLIAVSCTAGEVTTPTPGVATPTPTLLPYPDALDVVLVHDAVTVLINEARADSEMMPLTWDDGLQVLAEGRAWDIVKGAPFDVIDGALVRKLGEPAVELRACLSDNVTTPERVAEVAVEHWLARPNLREALLGYWERIGVGFDWGCPLERGVVLVVVLAGETGLRRG